MAQVLCPVVIGRDAELQALDAALTAAMAGHGRCAVIAGEPGIGKSRLAREIASRAAGRGIAVVTGRAVPQSATAPYRPFSDALLPLLRDRAVPDDPEMAPWLPALSALLPGAPGPGPAAGDVSPGVRGEAVIQLLRRLSGEGLVVVLEDLHWADPDSVALVEYLGDHLEGERLLWVLTLRSNRASAALDVARRQRGRPGIVHLSLDRLTDEDMARMVCACVPGAEADLLRRVQAAAEGVPLLAEDLLASPGLPASFTETVRERLAEFTEAQRAVIEAAAILGRHFDWELLPAASGQPAALAADTLGLAVERLLMSADGTAFRFRHALTREAVLETILPPRQRALAAAALASLDAAHPRLEGALREVAVDVAIRSGDRHRAGRLLTESGRRSLALAALATAVDTLRRAADLLEGTAEQVSAELALVEALALAGRVDEAAAAGGRVITRLGGDVSAQETRMEVHLRLAHAAVAASRWPMARHQLDAARRLAGSEPPTGVRARTAVLDAEVTFAADDPDGARRLAEGSSPGATIIRAVFAPGWKWSGDVKPLVGTESCQASHAGYLISGRFGVQMEDGPEYEFGPGDAYVVPPGHDAWVVGDEPAVGIDFAATGNALAGHAVRCPCGVEFRVASDDQLDHLVAAVRQHAGASHGHEVTAEQVLAEVTAS
jgi:hypothetical protein